MSRALGHPAAAAVGARVFAVAYTGMLGAGLFVSIRIVELGGQPSDVALSFGLSALAEVPGLIVAGWLVRQVGVRGWCG